MSKFQSLNFVVAFMSTVTVFTMGPSLPYFYATETRFQYFTVLLLAGFFPTVQMLFRRFYYRKEADMDQLFFTCSLHYTKLFDRLLYYLPVALVSFYPLAETNRPYTDGIPPLLLGLFLAEGLLYITRRRVHLRVYQGGVAVSGTDFRIDLPMADQPKNPYGKFSYADFEAYRLRGDRLELILYDDTARIDAAVDPGQAPAITAFLSAQGIQPQKESR